MMGIYHWFDANCSWIYNNTNIFQSMFFNNHEMPIGMMILKCIIMGLWYFMIFVLPLFICVRGFGYIIGGWIGRLPAFFIEER